MEQKEMRALIMAAESQGIRVRVLRKGQVVVFSTHATRLDGSTFTVSTVVTMDTLLPMAVYRLKRDVALMWLWKE